VHLSLPGRWASPGCLRFNYSANFTHRCATATVGSRLRPPSRSPGELCCVTGRRGSYLFAASRRSHLVFLCLLDPGVSHAERGLSLVAIGAVAWIPFLVSDVSNFATGILAQRLEHAGWSANRTRKCLMLTGAAVSPIGVAAVHTQSLFWTMTFICIAIFFWMIWSVTVQTLPGDYFPPHAVASVYGLVDGLHFGFSDQHLAGRRTLDVTHSYSPVFVGLGMLMPVACVAGMSLMGRVERVELRA